MEGTDHFVTTWRKSTHSGGNGSDCVEVGGSGETILVRDTKNCAGAVLTFGPDEWRGFAARRTSTGQSARTTMSSAVGASGPVPPGPGSAV
ncbi:MAG TPA: DUF397 domain-containing protein [Trebonia sp.]|jgi:hypothetical protein|nr:DUF397 domain-containing protein [Trebonia sp.]